MAEDQNTNFPVQFHELLPYFEMSDAPFFGAAAEGENNYTIMTLPNAAPVVD